MPASQKNGTNPPRIDEAEFARLCRIVELGRDIKRIDETLALERRRVETVKRRAAVLLEHRAKLQEEFESLQAQGPARPPEGGIAA